ncbi:hypothetical protein I4U23_015222 [Adineta vaga]|nr:hypothetical protein I4U23_015222 [Adineta vaga]
MGGVQRRLTSNVDHIEASILIWLDATVKTKQESIDATHQLKSLLQHFKAFDREVDCQEYIKLLKDNERVILIVSGSLGYTIVPQIEKNPRIQAIYVYCGNKKNNEWAKKYPKVRGLAVELGELISQIRCDQSKEQITENDDALAFATFDEKADKEKLATGLNGEFVHSQLLIDCLLGIPSDSADFKELIFQCQQRLQNEKDELKLTQEFHDTYVKDRAVYWYTRHSFVYRMLNRALRTQDIHSIYLFRFLIRDLEEKLKRHRCSSPVTVYRGQFLWPNELEYLEQSKGRLISINSFLSTSLNRDLAFSFVTQKNGLERILFEIYADPRLPGIKPFANISELSEYRKEAEVLFMLGSIFRIGNILYDRNGLCTIRLTLCGDENHELKEIFQTMKSEDKQIELDLIRLGSVLQRMGKYTDAERYYRRCLDDSLRSNDSHHISTCYFSLGSLEEKKGNHDASLKFFNKSLEIDKKTYQSNHPNIANTYNSIGNIYQTIGDFERALEAYSNALSIFRRAHGDNHVHVAMCWNNIGGIFQRQKKYSDALKYYETALNIRMNCLTGNHYDIGASHYNIGTIYQRLGESNRALEHFNLALKIYKIALPAEHIDTATTLNHIAIVHDENRNWNEALSYYKKANVIYRKILSTTDADLVQNEKNIQRISSKSS